MAQVRLGRYEAREGLLPPVCMVCGAPASVQPRTILARAPGWCYAAFLFGVLPYFALTAYFGRRALVRTPLCELHKNHWLGRALFFGLLFMAYAAVVVPAFFLSQLGFDDIKHTMDAERFRNLQRVGTLLGLLVALGGPPVLLGVYLWLRYSAIHATEITAHSLTLEGVVAEFCEALRVERRDETPAAAVPADR
jgi:hypothetical protein